MPDFSVTLEFETDKPLTDDDLERAARHGGAASGRVGERRLVVTMTVENVTGAGTAALFAAVELAKVVPGHGVTVEAIPIEEADRRLKATATDRGKRRRRTS
jgi:hypothetical protein